MPVPSAAETVRALSLSPHPEGGHYRQTYCADEAIADDALPARYDGARAHATAIYFLLAAGEVSHLHRLASDEVWHFYRGTSLVVHVLAPDGRHVAHRLGHNTTHGEVCQLVVPRGHWFGAELAAPDGYALVGNTVAPGFDFADFELARADDLAAAFPQHAELIQRLSAR
ncbi:cupin domain-containing protein [uncultured Salinisphaera sp.]|uniref:cupin domain-containing protein n=1 Tax=uncultured Salinisphaera sp. TaxID=359372 RepID=UPI0032B175FC|tara:strand:- start:5587 stop:6096 length:510 start_codon:yes stop_codon:yes gene_type:complete